MEFRLYYRGPLKPNGDSDHKHDIRLKFHEQLQELWHQEPLAGHNELLAPNPQEGSISLVEKVGPHQFVPLVSQRIHLAAELDILLLRPEERGHIITHGGDIDNRLKTLLDSLRMPGVESEIPRGACKSMPCPLYCLLQDDRLVTSVSIATDRWLARACTIRDAEVILVIHVKVKPTKGTILWLDLL
jgi:hypothetical protein